MRWSYGSLGRLMPVVGGLSSIYELISGRNMFSGHPGSRYWAAIGVMTFGYGRPLGSL